MSRSLIIRSAQEIITDLPSHIAINGEHCGKPVIVVQPGSIGYWAPLYAEGKSLDQVDELHERVFGARKPTDAEREAAAIGSMMGWDVPGADPLNYR